MTEQARRLGFLAVVALSLLASPAWAAPKVAPYEYYSAGNLGAPHPAVTSAGLMLLGGGDWPVPAFRWFVERMGGGHLVILRASGTDDLQQDFLEEIGGAASVQTLVFHSRDAAGDARVQDIIRKADGIFIGGGDQANYVRYFRGTPLNELLDAHVRGGKPIGGTSAGLAILGAYSYGAMDNGSLLSKDALKDPLGSGVTLVRDFLHMPLLGNVITDSHFAIRERFGRLLVFVGRLATEENNASITGLGIDEKAALCVEPDGKGRVYANGRGFAWLVRPMRAPDLLEHGPFNFRSVPVVGIGEESRIDLRDFSVTNPSFSLEVNVVNGKFDEASWSALKAAAQTPPPPQVADKTWALAIHGGAGVIERGDLQPGQEAAYRASLNAALAAGE
jgi:beta-aspartyl-peptidase (threonine type)